jgi:hypothetical protein
MLCGAGQVKTRGRRHVLSVPRPLRRTATKHLRSSRRDPALVTPFHAYTYAEGLRRRVDRRDTLSEESVRLQSIAPR